MATGVPRLAFPAPYFHIASAAVPKTMRARPMRLRRERISVKVRRGNNNETRIVS